MGCRVKRCKKRGLRWGESVQPLAVCEEHYRAISWKQTMRVIESKSTAEAEAVIAEVIEELGALQGKGGAA
jgi:hypothetical protein